MQSLSILSLWIEPQYVTIQMKAFEQYRHVVLYKAVLTFKSVDENLMLPIQIKACEQYLYVVPNKVVITFKSVDETPVCDHSNESYSEVLSCLFIKLFLK